MHADKKDVWQYAGLQHAAAQLCRTTSTTRQRPNQVQGSGLEFENMTDLHCHAESSEIPGTEAPFSKINIERDRTVSHETLHTQLFEQLGTNTPSRCLNSVHWFVVSSLPCTPENLILSSFMLP